MGFISSLTRSKLYSIFKHPIVRNTITQSFNLSNKAKLSGSTCNNPTSLLFSRAHKRVHYSSSNLGVTQLRNYHNGHGVTHYTNSVMEYVVRKWDSLEFVYKLHYAIVGCTAFIWFVVCNWETVPYTNRKHFIPSSYDYDRLVDKTWYHTCLFEFRHILGKNDPTSRRVFKITNDLLRALEKDLKLGNGSMKLSYCSECKKTKETFKRVQNMSWLERRRERKAGRYHLHGMHWEVMVADGPTEETCCLPNGKIVVSTDLLKLCETDHDIATLIGHEVGHVVARHAMEKRMIDPGILTIVFFCRLAILIPFMNWWYLHRRKALIDYPIIRRLEAEADRIGMLLMASAGYDPRKVPDVYMKLFGDDDEQIPSHHTGKKRAEMLRKESVMQEAVALYNKVISESKQGDEN